MTMLHRSLFPVALRGALLALSLCAFGAAQAQQIDDVPPAVQNNVPPNFMFMIDNSGSMNNIVPAAPYVPTATYLASCPGGSTVAAGTSVDIRVSNALAYRIQSGGLTASSSTGQFARVTGGSIDGTRTLAPQYGPAAIQLVVGIIMASANTSATTAEMTIVQRAQSL